MLIKNPLFYLVLILALLAGMLAVNFVKATYTGPAETFPEGIPESPLDLSSNSQTKEGGLTVSGLVITPSTEITPLYLNENGICMRENLSGSPSCKSYWDQITKWSHGGGGSVYYNTGIVGIGTSNLSSGVKLDIDGKVDVNSNRIVNVGSPDDYSDAATKKYADYAQRTFENEVSGSVMNDEGEEKVIPLGDDWDFCFLTKFGRNGKGKDLAKQIARSRCEVTESGGAWSLVIESDLRGHTNCKAKCVDFGRTGGEPPALPPPSLPPSPPDNFEAVYDTSTGELSFGWRDVMGETAYEIEYSKGAVQVMLDKNNNWTWLTPSVAHAKKESSTNGWTHLIDVDANTESYSTTKSADYGKYWYSIRACNDAGCSPRTITEATEITSGGGNGGGGSPPGGPDKPKEIPQKKQ